MPGVPTQEPNLLGGLRAPNKAGTPLKDQGMSSAERRHASYQAVL
jgi:hypothetical protein